MDPRILDRLDALHARLHRWRWRVRAVLAAVLIPYAFYVAYGWMHMEPAVPIRAGFAVEPGLQQPPPELDRTAELVAAIQALPPEATPGPPTSPPGYQWQQRDGTVLTPQMTPGCTFTDALTGEWTPESRYWLQHMIAYLEMPQMGAALDRVVALRGQAFCLREEDMRLPPFGPLRNLAMLLTVRARYWMDHRGDVERATGDLDAVLHLADETQNDGGAIRVMVAGACRGLAISTILALAREHALRRDEAEQLGRVVASHRTDPRGLWQSVVEAGRAEQMRWLDGTYTRDPHGNGRLVLHSRGMAVLLSNFGYGGVPTGTQTRLMSLLNGLAVAVNDRRTMTHKINVACDRALRAGDVLYEQGRRILPDPSDGDATAWEWKWNPADGLVGLFMQATSDRRLYDMLFQYMAMEAGAQAAVGLSAYLAENGRYPERLDELVPDYLADLPLDPIDRKPLRYRLDEQEGYVLYSVGPDGKDDGGRLPAGPAAQTVSRMNLPDWVITQPRREPESEWYLVPIGGTDATTAPAAGDEP